MVRVKYEYEIFGEPRVAYYEGESLYDILIERWGPEYFIKTSIGTLPNGDKVATLRLRSMPHVIIDDMIIVAPQQ